MKPVNCEFGQCFGAAVASVLELELADVPNIPLPTSEWLKAVEHLQGEERYAAAFRLYEKYMPTFSEEFVARWDAWFSERGIVGLQLPADYKHKGYSVLMGRQGRFSHCLVALDGVTVFDPESEPCDDEFICESVLVLAPTDPARLTKLK